MASNYSPTAFLDPQMDPSALAKYMVFNQEVKEALAQKKPVVALESTGMSLFGPVLHSPWSLFTYSLEFISFKVLTTENCAF